MSQVKSKLSVFESLGPVDTLTVSVYLHFWKKGIHGTNFWRFRFLIFIVFIQSIKKNLMNVSDKISGPLINPLLILRSPLLHPKSIISMTRSLQVVTSALNLAIQNKEKCVNLLVSWIKCMCHLETDGLDHFNKACTNGRHLAHDESCWRAGQVIIVTKEGGRL